MKRLSAEEANRSRVVIDQYNGIISYFEVIYIDAIWFAAERPEDAFAHLDIALSEAIDPSISFGLLQEALGHAAAVSRFFWPARSVGELALARGKRLRDGFKVEETSPLKSRDFRNTIEHYDEKLDMYFLRDIAGVMFPRPIIESIDRLQNEAISHIFKMIDPAAGACILLGERFEYLAIRNEIKKVIFVADEIDRSGGRLPWRG